MIRRPGEPVRGRVPPVPKMEAVWNSREEDTVTMSSRSQKTDVAAINSVEYPVAPMITSK